MATLEEIRSGFDELFMLVEDADGEWSDEAETLLARLMANAEHKAGGYIAVSREYEAYAKANKDIAAKYTKKAKSAQNAADRLKKRLAEFMEDRSIDHFDTEIGKIKLQYSKSVYVDPNIDTEGLEKRFVREIPARIEPDKKAIGDALKNGEEIPGATIDKTPYVRVY